MIDWIIAIAFGVALGAALALSIYSRAPPQAQRSPGRLARPFVFYGSPWPLFRLAYQWGSIHSINPIIEAWPAILAALSPLNPQASRPGALASRALAPRPWAVGRGPRSPRRGPWRAGRGPCMLRPGALASIAQASRPGARSVDPGPPPLGRVPAAISRF